MKKMQSKQKNVIKSGGKEML